MPCECEASERRVAQLYGVQVACGTATRAIVLAPTTHVTVTTAPGPGAAQFTVTVSPGTPLTTTAACTRHCC